MYDGHCWKEGSLRPKTSIPGQHRALFKNWIINIKPFLVSLIGISSSIPCEQGGNKANHMTIDL